MFNKRIWLNGGKNASTGSAVAYAGKRKWKGKNYNEIFLSISDCNVSARIHKSQDDNKKDFIRKLRKLRKLIDEFIYYLEK